MAKRGKFIAEKKAWVGLGSGHCAGIIYIGRPLCGSREKRKSDPGVRLPI